jgi:hypothetical protein
MHLRQGFLEQQQLLIACSECYLVIVTKSLDYRSSIVTVPSPALIHSKIAMLHIEHVASALTQRGWPTTGLVQLLLLLLHHAALWLPNAKVLHNLVDECWCLLDLGCSALIPGIGYWGFELF